MQTKIVQRREKFIKASFKFNRHIFILIMMQKGNFFFAQGAQHCNILYCNIPYTLCIKQ